MSFTDSFGVACPSASKQLICMSSTSETLITSPHGVRASNVGSRFCLFVALAIKAAPHSYFGR
eukprot:scaffold4813_cov16-Prasinocladus_malaysianus.AAC.1